MREPPSEASPLAELLEDDSVGEALAADSDPLQDTVTPELFQDQVSVQFPRLQKKEKEAFCRGQPANQKRKKNREEGTFSPHTKKALQKDA